MKYFIQTYGCQMNYSDSERIATILESLNYEPTKSQEDADLIILNTCSVRQKAEDRVTGLRRTLAKLKKKNPRLRIAITGCMVRKTSTQESGKKDKVLRTMPEVDIAFKINELARLPELLPQTSKNPETFFVDEGSLKNYFKIAPKKESKAQVIVPIQAGCDKFCTYCIVPFARGREKSRDMKEVLAECKKHVEEGAIEITLAGQTVNSYGLSFLDKKSGKFEELMPSPFALLLKEIDKLHEHGLRRLRFMSPHPRDFSGELIQTLAELKTACPYIHMPVQSGDDETLRRMNRNYHVAEYKEIVKKLKKAIPGCAISTDIIVGFCGETDEEFENTYQMYKDIEWDMCFLAKYSPRKGTYSERKLKDDVPAKVKAARWRLINDELLVPILAKKHAAFAGKTLEVLVEKQDGNSCSGRTPESKEVFFKSDQPVLGTLVQVKVTKAGKLCLEGEPV
jgi:tRNA-2-methylthio-N6-dimethylallyladenosine synthase